MGNTTKLVLGLLLGALGSSACHSDGSGGLAVAITGDLTNDNFDATILNAEMFLDNSRLSTCAGPSASCQFTGTKSGIGSGAHTISFKLIDQTATPSCYTANKFAGVVAYGPVDGSGTTNTVDLAARSKCLDKNGEISYSVSLH